MPMVARRTAAWLAQFFSKKAKQVDLSVFVEQVGVIDESTPVLAPFEKFRRKQDEG